MRKSLRCVPALLFLATALTLSAQTNWSITPSSGPTTGGQEVIVKGNFGSWPYSLLFGSAAVPATRVDDTTLRAITPPHPAGTVEVVVFEFDMGVSNGLMYEFQGDTAAAYERVLLPILTPPILGAHGSEFRTDFRLYNNDVLPVLTYGLFGDCGGIVCPDPGDGGFYLAGNYSLGDLNPIARTGNPGAFVYIPKDTGKNLTMQLRVYDVSREATNFGTEIPVVYSNDMRRQPITLLGVPTDSRFRDTLRIYGTYAWKFKVTVEGSGYQAEHFIELSEPQNIFHPAYGVFTAFPANIGPVRVTIDAMPSELGIYPPPPAPEIWAFATVTNNETQHITVISPQR